MKRTVHLMADAATPARYGQGGFPEVVAMRVMAFFCAFTALASPVEAFARDAKVPLHHRHLAPPSADAVALGILAPPTRLSTLQQTYGDAAIARSSARQGYSMEERSGRDVTATTGAPSPCDPRTARATVYECADPHYVGYGQGYAYTPSYVSAPQVFRSDPFSQDSILPPATAFFWSLN